MNAHNRRGIIASIAVAVLSVSFLAFKQIQLWGFRGPAGEIEAFLVAELPKAKQVVIYSLNPVKPRHQRIEGPPSNRPKLHDWEILGQAELSSNKEYDIVATAFLDSLRRAR